LIVFRTESYGAGYSDFWLVKTDTKEEKQWNNTYGGYYHDGADSIQQTRDGGYIIAVITQSFGAGHNDFLLVKTDSNGTEQWFRTLGGSNHEFDPSIRLSPDDGYILGGMTFSFDGYWLIKTDEDGNVHWDIEIEGDKSDSVLQTGDGGYILAGIKNSKLLLVKLMAERPALSAQFTTDPGYPGANQTITFDASASHDPYGNITYYQWDLGDGIYMNTTQRKVMHSYDEGDNYIVGLIVTGINDEVSSITRKIIVQQSGPPIMR